MDLWSALGVTPQSGLIAVGIGLAAALALAARIVLRGRGASRSGGLGLDDR